MKENWLNKCFDFLPFLFSFFLLSFFIPYFLKKYLKLHEFLFLSLYILGISLQFQLFHN